MKKPFGVLVLSLALLAFSSLGVNAQNPDLTGSWTGFLNAVAAEGQAKSDFFQQVPVEMKILKQQVLSDGYFSEGLLEYFRHLDLETTSPLLES